VSRCIVASCVKILKSGAQNFNFFVFFSNLGFSVAILPFGRKFSDKEMILDIFQQPILGGAAAFLAFRFLRRHCVNPHIFGLATSLSKTRPSSSLHGARSNNYSFGIWLFAGLPTRMTEPTTATMTTTVTTEMLMATTGNVTGTQPGGRREGPT